MKSILDMNQDELSALTLEANAELAKRMAPVRRRGFGTVSSLGSKPCFKLFNSTGDEFSLSVDGEICVFTADKPNTIQDGYYPVDAEELVRLMAAFLGLEVK